MPFRAAAVRASPTSVYRRPIVAIFNVCHNIYFIAFQLLWIRFGKVIVPIRLSCTFSAFFEIGVIEWRSWNEIGYVFPSRWLLPSPYALAYTIILLNSVYGIYSLILFNYANVSLNAFYMLVCIQNRVLNFFSSIILRVLVVYTRKYCNMQIKSVIFSCD